jgi:membrane protease subunit HflK
MAQQSYNPFGGGSPDLGDFGRGLSRYRKLIVGILVVGALLALSTLAFYQVEPEEVALVTRFGRFDRIEDSGLRFRIPLVERVHLVPSKMQLKAEFGFRTELAGIKSSFRRDAVTLQESSMLTGDLNVALVEWIVHYQIADPYKFVFRVRDQESTLRALAEATTSKVVGDYSVTEVLTSGRDAVLEKAQIELQELCSRYETGVSIQRIELKDSAPPDPVKPSFNEVNQAEQERDRLLNEAEAQYNAEIPRAKGQAKQILEEAEGYAIERVNRARGDVARFAALQKEYAASPRVTRARIYLETMSDVVPRAGRRIFIDEAARGVVPMLLPLNEGPLPVTAAPRGGAQ